MSAARPIIAAALALVLGTGPALAGDAAVDAQRIGIASPGRAATLHRRGAVLAVAGVALTTVGFVFPFGRERAGISGQIVWSPESTTDFSFESERRTLTAANWALIGTGGALAAGGVVLLSRAVALRAHAAAVTSIEVPLVAVRF